MFSKDVGHHVESSIIIKNLKKPHCEKIHSLTVANLRELNWQGLQNIEKWLL